MKFKILFLLAVACLSVSSFAQNVGIGTASPGTKLDVNGAVTYRETVVAISGNAATIPSNVSQVRLSGTATATITLTAPTAPPNAGQQLVIYNNTTGGYGATYGTTTIPDGVAISFIYSNSAWVASSDASSGSSSYIENQTTQQASSNFNISGSGEIGTTAIIGTGDGTSSATGGTLRAPNAGGATSAGGSLTISGGYSYGNAAGGNVSINGGTTNTSGTGSAANGTVNINGGVTTGVTTGAVNINATGAGSTYLNTAGGAVYVGANTVLGTGDATAAPAGITLRGPNAGSGNTAGGTAALTAGYGWGSGPGGSVYVTGGSAGGSGGTNGNAYIRGGSGNSAEGAVYINDGAGTAYFGNTYINQNSSGTGGGNVYIGSGTGMIKTTAGLVSVATAGTDYQAPITAGTGLYYSATNTLASYWTYTSPNLTNNNTGIVNITTATVIGSGEASGAPGTGTLRGPNAGSGNASGGSLNINAGYAYGSGTGGNVTVTGGTTGTGTNGNTILRGGYSNSAEGYVLINDDHTGKVGMGTSTPQTQLEVSAAATDLLKITSTTGGAGNHAYIDFSTFATATNNYLDARIGAVDLNSNNGGLVFETGNQGTASTTTTERMRILNTGYIGMGITVPASNLHVLASSGQGIIIDAPSGSQGLMFYSGGSSTASGTQKGALALAGSAGAWSTDAATNDMVLRSSSGNKVLINTNAGTGASTLAVNGSLVGVGTTAPAVKLHVIASSNTDGILIQNTAGGSGAQANLYFETYAGESIAGADIAGIDDGNYSAHLTFSTRVPGSSGNSLAERMRLSSAGFLGINNTAPAYPLDVDQTTEVSFGSYGYLNSGGNVGSGSSGGNQPYSIHATGRITCPEFDAVSDMRIKKDRTASDPQADLQTLLALSPVEFRYIDSVQSGHDLKKGFIAQEVMKVFPQAVQTLTDFIPSVYQMSDCAEYDPASHELHVTLAKPHGLHAGDKVKTMVKGSGKIVNTVSSVVSGTEFTLSDWTSPATDMVFVYGKEVPDFHTVDYDRIYTLNVSATQELARQLKEEQAKNKTLEDKNKMLEQQISDIHAENKATKADIDKMKASVETLQQIIGSKAEK